MRTILLSVSAALAIAACNNGGDTTATGQEAEPPMAQGASGTAGAAPQAPSDSPNSVTGTMTVTPSRGISPDTSQSDSHPTQTNANGTTSVPRQ